ncbi:MAG: isoprenylcysteine carboxylmethyltransferase family protein [Acidobacteria bacterium]|nr:isoprenylcysteine carboxylmethyltransferase family protein [Acidobacteriota bacterium]
MAQILTLVYGFVAYAVFLGAFLYAIGFVGNIFVPKSIDSGATFPLMETLVTNVLLLTLFAVQHSVMARPAFKRWWTRIVPKQIERSTYVLLASLILLLLFWQWRPITGVVWDARSTMLGVLLLGLFGVGWLIVLLSTFMIDHFDLFGLRQVTLYFQQRPYTPVSFVTRGLYKIVRHPIMLGFLIAFWATPVMTLGHLMFTVITTAYILVALQLEEHDLLEAHRQTYERYRRETPMLIPLPTGKRKPAPVHEKV